MIPVPSWALRLSVTLLAAGALFGSGWWIGRDGAQDEAREEVLLAEAKAEKVRQATEDGWRRAHWDLAYAAEEKRAEREREVQADIDRLRAGAIRVRERFVCPKATPAPGVATEPDAKESGLLQSDAEFLLRFAAEADTIADERNQCIASYNALMDK